MTSARTTIGDLISDALGSLGVERVYGAPLGRLHHVALDDNDLALLLADADGRIGHGWGAAFVDGQILHLSCQPGGTATPRTVTSADGALAALGALTGSHVPRTVALHLDLDLDEPLDDYDGAELSTASTESVVVTLSPSLADLSMVAVVGPGVTRGGHGEALAQFAAGAGVGVFNTFGAKGVLRWDSPFHFGTIGLQQLDVELAELAEFDLVITSGLDPDEFGPADLGPLVIQDVAPWQIGALLADWPRAKRTVDDRPQLYSTISEIVTPLYEQQGGAVTPPRAALHLSGAAPAGAVVVADTGVAGYWIARTFPTGHAGSVVVPAIAQPGFAVAAALVAALSGRACLAVTDAPLDAASQTVLDAADRLGAVVAVQIWEPGSTTPDEHVQITSAGFAASATRVDTVGVDDGCLDALVAALGPVTAWT